MGILEHNKMFVQVGNLGQSKNLLSPQIMQAECVSEQLFYRFLGTWIWPVDFMEMQDVVAS